MSGKGDTPRPCDGGKFRENYDRIFRKSPLEQHFEAMGEELKEKIAEHWGLTEPKEP